MRSFSSGYAAGWSVLLRVELHQSLTLNSHSTLLSASVSLRAKTTGRAQGPYIPLEPVS